MGPRDIVERSHGICYNRYSFNEFCCSECGCEIAAYDGRTSLWRDGLEIDQPLYCPMCGRVVVTKERYEFLTPTYKQGK